MKDPQTFAARQRSQSLSNKKEIKAKRRIFLTICFQIFNLSELRMQSRMFAGPEGARARPQTR